LRYLSRGDLVRCLTFDHYFKKRRADWTGEGGEGVRIHELQTSTTFLVNGRSALEDQGLQGRTGKRETRGGGVDAKKRYK